MRLFLLASIYLPCVLAQNLKAEYLVKDQDDTHVLPLTAATTTTTTTSSSNNNMNYIFLQRFPLQDTLDKLYHTEVLVCPFSPDNTKNVLDTDYLPQLKKHGGSLDFVEIPKDLWGIHHHDSNNNNNNLRSTSLGSSASSLSKMNCVELGYGGAMCVKNCCGVPHTEKQTSYELGAEQSVISNAVTSEKALFLYGTWDSSVGNDTDENAITYDPYDLVCGIGEEHKCHSRWSGLDYNLITNNCNTFTSVMLSCVFDLSQQKPHLGVSDMMTVNCKCEPEESEPESPEFMKGLSGGMVWLAVNRRTEICT